MTHEGERKKNSHKFLILPQGLQIEMESSKARVRVGIWLVPFFIGNIRKRKGSDPSISSLKTQCNGSIRLNAIPRYQLELKQKNIVNSVSLTSLSLN
jgi:hypothetical protein